MHGRSSWTRKGGDEKERCWKAFEKKSGVERAILSPFECFLFEKWNFMRNGVRYGSDRLITFAWLVSTIRDGNGSIS